MGYFYVVKWLKVVFDFYIRSSLHVAICFVVLSHLFSNLSFQFYYSYRFLILQFLLVICAYNMAKYLDLFLKKKDFKFKKSIIVLTAISAIAAAALSIDVLPYAYLYFISISILVLAYSFPVLKNKSLREFVFLKTPIVALCWTLLIMSSYSTSAMDFVIDWRFLLYNADVYLLTPMSIFFFVVALCIPFEIKDLPADAPYLITLPQKIGVKRTKYIGYVTTILFAVTMVIGWTFYGRHRDSELLAFIVVVFTLLISIKLSDRIKSPVFVNFFVEAIPMLWLILQLFFSAKFF